MHRAVVPAQDPIWSNLCRLPGRLREASSGPAEGWVGASAGWIAPAAGRGSGCHDARVEPGTHDASRRTYLAEERTLLAWWRSRLAAFAVAVGVGRLLSVLLDEDGHGPFVALGVAYALLGLGLVLFGSLREQAQAKALAEGGFAPLSRALVIALTAYLALLGLATITLVLSV
jgi:uncharacterized membrane protein YidH (DUF202 family)